MDSTTQPPRWSPERVVTPELATSLLSSQFPHLAPVNVAPFAAGWDNTVYRVNDAFVVRFPRRRIAVPLIEHECRILPSIASQLPIQIPVPTLVGRPAGDYPWPFAGYALLPGVTADVADLSLAVRQHLALPLAHFLTALHIIDAQRALALGAGPDTIGRWDPELRIGRASACTSELVEAGLIPAIDWLSMLESTPLDCPPDSHVLVHGDLYARNLLVTGDGTPTAVIDWGDVHCGDRAVDLAAAFMLFPENTRRRFFRAYGPVDEATWLRARFRAIYHAANVAHYAREIGDAALLREELTALRFIAGGQG